MMHDFSDSAARRGCFLGQQVYNGGQQTKSPARETLDIDSMHTLEVSA